MCVFRLDNLLNPFPHSPHTYGLSPVSDKRLNLFPHSPHTCGLSLVCVLFCRFWSDKQVRLFSVSPRTFPVAAANIYFWE
ncbi:hypothetical protein FKM82_025700 [Ascaphus truei]